MFLLLWLVLSLVALFILWLPLILRRHGIHHQYSGSRLVACPENQQSAAVTVDTRHAMATAIDGSPHLVLFHCTRWPERRNCNQACLPQATQAASKRA